MARWRSHNTTTTALALLAHALASAQDARPVLDSLIHNLEAIQANEPPSDELLHMAQGLLLTLSSLALKQHPQDPWARKMYAQVRDGTRH